MFNVSLIGDQELIEKIDQMPAAVQAALYAKATALAIKLQGHIVRDKLHGQVLSQRSGALARSIEEEVSQDETSVIAKVFSAGDVKYAAFWEYGYHGTETVKQHTRTMVFGKTVAPFSVGPFSRKVDQDPRSFMRTSLADMAEEITTGLKKAAVEGLNKAIGHAA